MEVPGNILINDHLFHQTLSCPLKLAYELSERSHRNPFTNFRQRTKLAIRNAIALTLPSPKFTSDDPIKAKEETESWLKKKEVTICGAVLQAGNFLTRIPILKKSGNLLTIVQVHGKLLRRPGQSPFSKQPKSYAANGYLLKAAYRLEIAERAVPGNEFSCEFIFPLKRFTAGHEALFQAALGKKKLSKEAKKDFKQLFITIEATRETEEVRSSIPADHAYHRFEGLSVEECTAAISEITECGRTEVPDKIHPKCKYCHYRKEGAAGNEGCWELHFPDSNLLHPELHLFELIGHGEAAEVEDEHFFREQIEQPPGLESVQKVLDVPLSTITLTQRRALQLFCAKNQEVPLVWVKPLVKNLADFPMPLHFIDFEAATHPIPMRQEGKPYDPVLFQYSCHTLRENGEISHSEWLDLKPSEFPHRALIDSLLAVPGIEKGTIMQYSPFERQAFVRLLRELEEAGEKEAKRYDAMKKILDPANRKRFCDLNRVVRDGYYNRFMDNGLTLKQVMKSIVKTEQMLGHDTLNAKEIAGSGKLIQRMFSNYPEVNPFSGLPYPDLPIRDGAEAMYAYLAMKSGIIIPKERKELPGLLRDYCALDSYALLILYKHLSTLMQKDEGEVVIFDWS